MNEPIKSTHAALETLEYEDGILLWGGRKVTEIAEELGQTHFYAYDRARMSQRVAELRTALPDDLKLHYAMKANPMPEVASTAMKPAKPLSRSKNDMAPYAPGSKRNGWDPRLNHQPYP